MDNTENNWKDFLASCIAYFIIMIIYALIGVDLIILSKEFSGVHKDYTSVTNIDYLYPTDDNAPPYTGKYESNKSSQSNNNNSSSSSDKSCKKCKISADTKIDGKDTSTAWPYNYLHNVLKDNSSLSEDFVHWYKYKFANIVYRGYNFNREVMKLGLDMLCRVPDIILILFGPIIIKLLIFVATIWGSIGSVWGLIEIASIGEAPKSWFSYVILAIFIVCIVITALINNFIDMSTWYGIIINIIISMITIGLGGFFAIVICFMPMFLMFSSIFSLLYPLYFDKGESVLGKFADYKDILSLLYAAGVCILATINLNITVASTMWVVFAILVIMKIVSFF